jgi:hypothetical protein
VENSDCYDIMDGWSHGINGRVGSQISIAGLAHFSTSDVSIAVPVGPGRWCVYNYVQLID